MPFAPLRAAPVAALALAGALLALPARAGHPAPRPSRSSPPTPRPARSASPSPVASSPSARVVPWARAGVGAVATQAYANTTFGPRGLELLARGAAAAEALDVLLRADDGRDRRQVGIVAADGRVRDLHRPRLQRLGGRTQRPRLRRAGQHPGRRGGRRRDGEGLPRERGQAAGRADARGAARRRRRRRRRARQAVARR